MNRDTYYDYEKGTLPKIRNCPFCNGKGILLDNSFESPVIDAETGAFVDMEYESADLYWCYCEECGASMDSFESPKKAIKAWNRRYKNDRT